MAWNPDQYLRFAQPRLRPALDLISHIPPVTPTTVFDLGCGTGHVTRLLAERWPDATITGVDDSVDMLAKAAAGTGGDGIAWTATSVAKWRPERSADVVFSNAALHWLPDHERLFTQLLESVAAGGVFAVQMPRNFAAPSHTAIAETVQAGPWRAQLEPLLRPSPVQEPGWYHALLKPLARSLDIWETEYLHVLEGDDPVKEWTKGTWLKPVLDALTDSQCADFEREYSARVARAYPKLDDGTTLFPFRRLFMVMVKL
jgi:trans-aconitate 2-methyltransferase